MDWVVIQVSPWAEKNYTTQDLTTDVHRSLKNKTLKIYYPVIEDIVGKHNTPFSEYLFVEYREGIQYMECENSELITKVMRNSQGNYETVPDLEIDKIKETIDNLLEDLEPGSKITVIQGSFRGNKGTVVCSDNGQVVVKLVVGEQIRDEVIPRRWLEKLGD